MQMRWAETRVWSCCCCAWSPWWWAWAGQRCIAPWWTPAPVFAPTSPTTPTSTWLTRAASWTSWDVGCPWGHNQLTTGQERVMEKLMDFLCVRRGLDDASLTLMKRSGEKGRTFYLDLRGQRLRLTGWTDVYRPWVVDNIWSGFIRKPTWVFMAHIWCSQCQCLNVSHTLLFFLLKNDTSVMVNRINLKEERQLVPHRSTWKLTVQ